MFDLLRIGKKFFASFCSFFFRNSSVFRERSESEDVVTVEEDVVSVHEAVCPSIWVQTICGKSNFLGNV